MIDVHIPVDKHVRKYLEMKYGKVHEASRNTVIGKLMLSSLTKKLKKPEKWTRPDFYYTIKVKEFYFKTAGQVMPYNTAQHIGDCLNTLFDEDMCGYLDIRVMQGGKAQPELKLFLKAYGITEDDVKFETLYRNYQRHIQRRIKKLDNNVA